MSEPIRVLVVDDSPFVCRLLTAHLQAAPGIEVVGTALGGDRAIEMVRELRPDVLTLDLEMPGMSGVECLGHIMAEAPTPVVVVSGLSRRAADATLHALRNGAVDFILKYTAHSDTDPELLREELVSKVRLAARMKTVRALTRPVEQPVLAGVGASGGEAALAGAEASYSRPMRPWNRHAVAALSLPVVVIGASTGGPIALRELLAALPSDFPVAIVIVQHMPAMFTRVLAAQLSQHIALDIKEAENGDALERGSVLVAPGEQHFLVQSDGRVSLVRGPQIGGYCPSIDVTMQSVAEVFGRRARGVVLTGMGADGAMGLLAIRSRGGSTFAQEPGSCVVRGMPDQAIARGAVDFVAAPAQIAEMLKQR